jgi:peptidoglycan/xylan/chitin deacetylase (PgdA/CDA1 family)
MRYPFAPLPDRGALRWPDGKRLALILTINLEYWDLTKDSAAPYYAGGPAILPDALPGNIADFPNYSWREYGQRVGVWRLFDIFDQAGVKPSCTMNAKMALERKPVIDAALARGCELIAHNYEQGELLCHLAHRPDEERRLIGETLAVYEQATGRKAKGWLSSSLRGTVNTPEILAENGLAFWCDLMNDDQPYMIDTDSGPIVALPYSIEINDFTLFQRRGLTNEAALACMKEQFDVLYAEGARSGMMMNVGLHPHVVGVPHRVRAVREFLAYAQQFDGVWWATREEVAACYAAQHATHIPPTARKA